MGSDRALISFNRSRDYRSVVTQQGRVTLEADINEQNTIASEALRVETIDIVGPAGTPDDGYKVSVGAEGHVWVGPGIMYLGGWRLSLVKSVDVASQPEWLDQPDQLKEGRQLVALLAIEQEVSAVEDQALREVALGGPDTAARTKLMQHLVRLRTTQETCPTVDELAKLLEESGLVLNPNTLGLTFANATLQVSFFPPSQPSDPCCPPAQGGYLGADNQLVQVTVSSYDANKKTGTLLWGWNNASFLYRASVVNNSTVLQLSPAPVDAEHSPQPNQVVEVLRTTEVLGYPKDQNYIAAPQGLVVPLGSGTIFDPTTNQLTLPTGTSLPSDPNQLFVRLWQAQVPFNLGQPAQLDTVSGLQVTVNVDALPTGPLLSRPFWCFAVRPNTPQQLYPERYGQAPQPPDGPRQWITNLCVLVPGGDARLVPHDCRHCFAPLGETSCCTCCELVLDPSGDWLGELNEAVSGSAAAVSICFQPGQYAVSSKITFSNKAVKISGAGPSGTVLTGSSLEAVLEFDNCSSVGLFDLSVVAGTAGFSAATNTKNLQGAVTIRNCNQVDIERVSVQCADAELRTASCLAVYNLPAGTTPQQYNVRVLNSRFTPGHFQVGILMVNADRAQVEGNLIVTPQQSRGITLTNLANHPLVQSRLTKQLLHQFTIVDTTPSATKKEQKRLLRKQRLSAKLVARRDVAAKVAPRPSPPSPAPATPAPAPPPAAAGAPEPAAATPGQPAKPAATAPPPTPAPAGTPSPAAPTLGEPAKPGATAPPPTPVPAGTPEPKSAAPVPHPEAVTPRATILPVTKLPHVNLGAVGRATITQTYGTFQLQFISSEKLTNAWTDALRASALTPTSSMGQIRRTVKSIIASVVKTPLSVTPAFRNYLGAILLQLYRTSAQGIVIGGDVANDIRILNNTIDGAAQGIHVGLSDLKAVPYQAHLPADRVQIRGNTVNIRMTPEMTEGRHGIYLGCVTSGIVSDNHVDLTRQSYAGQDTYALLIVGSFGQSLLIERNCVLGPFTQAIFAVPNAAPSSPVLWKASDNASAADNVISTLFTTNDNIPS